MTDKHTVTLGVNGTLMRGLALNGNLISVGAEFVRETRTAACYRLYSIGDRYPGMTRVTDGTGVDVALELWDVPAAAMSTILAREPSGLSIGKVVLEDGSIVLGVIAEPFLVADARDISEFRGWRAYTDKMTGE